MRAATATSEPDRTAIFDTSINWFSDVKSPIFDCSKNGVIGPLTQWLAIGFMLQSTEKEIKFISNCHPKTCQFFK